MPGEGTGVVVVGGVVGVTLAVGVTVGTPLEQAIEVPVPWHVPPLGQVAQEYVQSPCSTHIVVPLQYRKSPPPVQAAACCWVCCLCCATKTVRGTEAKRIRMTRTAVVLEWLAFDINSQTFFIWLLCRTCRCV